LKVMFSENNKSIKSMKKTKRELVELFNLLDDDVEIEFNVAVSRHWVNGKLKKIGISFL